MTQLQSTADSRARAKVLLQSWNCGDPASLQNQLETMARVQPAAGLPWIEYERWDLLAGIVQNMRSAMNRTQEWPRSCDIEVSVQLLNHLVAGSVE